MVGAAVVLTGPVERKAETDPDGHYSFEAVPRGTYQIEAVSSGLRAQQTITVEAHKVTDLDLQLRPSRNNEHGHSNRDFDRRKGFGLRDDFRADTARRSQRERAF